MSQKFGNTDVRQNDCYSYQITIKTNSKIVSGFKIRVITVFIITMQTTLIHVLTKCVTF